jgi:hypothetical protein
MRNLSRRTWTASADTVSPVPKTAWPIALLFLSACATGYHPLRIGGGYSEMRLSERAWRVNFTGNGYTSPERAASMALRRAAELTASGGFWGFLIVADTSYSQTSAWRTADQCETTGTVSNYGTSTATLSAQTSCTPGQTFVVSKPRSNMVITMISADEARQARPGTVVYEARLILSQPPEE